MLGASSFILVVLVCQWINRSYNNKWRYIGSYGFAVRIQSKKKRKASKYSVLPAQSSIHVLVCSGLSISEKFQDFD